MATMLFTTFNLLISVSGGSRSAVIKGLKVLRSEGIRGVVRRMNYLTAGVYGESAVQNSAHGNMSFVNATIPNRSNVLFSKWHIIYCSASVDTDRLSGVPITISAVTHNSERWLPEFFRTLRIQNFPLRLINIVFVDHQSSDNTVGLLKKYKAELGDEFRAFQIIQRLNDGFGSGHHAAIQKSNDQFVLVTNVDLAFHPESIARAVAVAMVDEPDVASWEFRQYPYEHPKYYDPITLETAWSSHACVLMRRSAYMAVGGYEPRIFMYGEDVELSYRFRGAGFRLRYLPKIGVTHFVDFQEPKMRPHQLSGSIAANLLLRIRYGSEEEAAEGYKMLAALIEGETDLDRRAAVQSAAAIVNRNKDHFTREKRPSVNAAFPFNGFDYVMSRGGHDVPMHCLQDGIKNGKVSVITRTHGPDIASLREAIVSVLNQSYSNVQHIIVEDRTDFAGDLIRAIAASYDFDIQYHQSAGTGRASAGNHGLGHATGDYLMFLDNDDYLFSDHVELLADKLQTNSGLLAAYALAWDVQTVPDDNEGYLEVMHTIPNMHRLPFDRERMKKCNFIPIQAILFSRSLYEQYGGFNSELDQLEDWNLWSRYSGACKFELIPKVTSGYHTPFDAEIRACRQRLLDGAYERVRGLNRSEQVKFFGSE
ncbi:glycosyltransferase [Rhodobacteraceae bacterium XHP0102]|nr:glycosyltransferase [Rhodobacteraceae bacterium XHP0102]